MAEGDINLPGWEGLEVLGNKPKDNQREIDVSNARTFNTKDGKKVLEYLISKTIKQPTWIPGSEPSFGYAREGQNSVIRDIQTRIERAKNNG